VAALAVVLCHAAVSAETVAPGAQNQPGHWLSLVLGWGYLGVPLFFVISGFCIHLPTAASQAAGRTTRPDWRRFFLRRFWRLYPPYCAALVVAVVLTLLSTGVLPTGWIGVAAQALLVQTLHPNTWDGVNPPAWTLAVEAQLYLAYPVMLALFVRCGPWRGLGAVLAITMLYRTSLTCGLVPDPFAGVAWEFFLARWWEWALGAFLAVWAVDAIVLPRLVRSPWLAGIVVALAVRMEWEMWRTGFYTIKEPLYGLAFALVVVASLDHERRTRAVGPTRIGAYLADVGAFSYSLYLIHRPIQLAVEPLVARIASSGIFGIRPFPISLSLMLALTPVVMSAARLFYRLCEAPSVAAAKRVGVAAVPPSAGFPELESG
jgi:peptidoglycan/LPS O-acetylase OafA/YrhL